jgi:hypothetical protein
VNDSKQEFAITDLLQVYLTGMGWTWISYSDARIFAGLDYQSQHTPTNNGVVWKGVYLI